MKLEKDEAITFLNQLGRNRTPFFFLTNFEGTYAQVYPKGQDRGIHWDFSGSPPLHHPPSIVNFHKKPETFHQFKKKYDRVIQEINFGNSFLVNLTVRTPIETNLSLDQIYQYSQARYKVHLEHSFVCFSPETFVEVRGNTIYSHPMKGTIAADVPNAARKIMEDVKEQAEHVTIVDLIRNDLSQFSKEVQVTDFRYIQKVRTHQKHLLQVSSAIQGKLSSNWQDTIGTLLFSLLPAGSISGAPKPKTLEIIKNVEGYERGFYTGICGHFDGSNLDSGVMIRFIEKEGDHMFFKSGGGITSFSSAETEYQEMIDKIYLPFDPE